MDAVLSGPVTIRVAGRPVLRGAPIRRAGELLLVEPDGTEVSAEAPVAALLTRADLIAALAPDGAPVEAFWAGPARSRLRLRRARGGAELLIEAPDGSVLDAHQAPIRAILPVRAWLFSRHPVA